VNHHLGFVLAAILSVGAAACSSEGARHKAAGNVHFKQGRLDAAVAEYRAAVAAGARDANAHTLLGNALYERAEYVEAEREYTAALGLDAHARAAAQGLATVYLRQHRTDEARRQLEALAGDPHDAEANGALGKLLFATGDLDGAERHLRDALVYAQNDAGALYTLGLVLAKRKDQEQANAIFDRLERVAPGKAWSPYGRALAAAAVGRDDDALKWLSVALDRGIEDLGEVERDEGFGALRSSPPFIALVTAARTRAPPGKGSPGP
jgi:tetratricopeptide (TPR) repeat protein